MLDPKTPAPDHAPSGPATPKSDAAEWHVETAHGRSLVAPDLATLHRWIIERRVTREDRISQDGKTWQRVGDVADLVPFFDIVDSAERARRADTPGPMLLPAPPPYNPHPSAVSGPVVIDRGAFPEVEDRTETKLVRTNPSRWSLPLKLGLTTLVAALAAYAGIALLNLRTPARDMSRGSHPMGAPLQPASAPTPTPPAEEPASAPAIEPLAAEEEEPTPEEEAPAAAHPTRKRARAATKAASARAGRPGGRRSGAAPAAAAPTGPSPQAMAAQGYAELNRRQFEKAIVHFKHALAGSPSNGTALFGLAEAYRETGQKPLALKAYRRYVHMLPSGPDAGSARLQIRLLEGKK